MLCIRCYKMNLNEIFEGNNFAYLPKLLICYTHIYGASLPKFWKDNYRTLGNVGNGAHYKFRFLQNVLLTASAVFIVLSWQKMWCLRGSDHIWSHSWTRWCIYCGLLLNMTAAGLHCAHYVVYFALKCHSDWYIFLSETGWECPKLCDENV